MIYLFLTVTEDIAAQDFYYETSVILIQPFYGLSQKTLQHKTSTDLRYFDLTFLCTVTEDIAAQDFY